MIVEEELDSIEIDVIGNLEDSPRLVFVDEECGNLIVVNDGGKRTKNYTKTRIRRFTVAYQCLLSYNALIQFLIGATGVVPPWRI